MITDEMVEAAARAEYEHDRFPGDPSWDEQDEAYRNCMRDSARRMLEAAQPLIESQIRNQLADLFTVGAIESRTESGPSPATAVWREAARLARGDA